MTNGNRAFLGAALGVLFGYGAFLGMIVLGPKQPGYLSTGAALLYLFFMFPVVLAATGPGALLLSWIHAIRMTRYARGARTAGGIRTAGILLGLPLGVANLILCAALLAQALGQRQHSVEAADLSVFLLLGAISGAGMGWGATIGLVPGASRPTPDPSALRRDGPPFFDGRPRRAA